MDMSRFKKTAEDHSTVTLHHPDGHKMVFHKGRMKKDDVSQLSKMPFEHVQGYSSGGNVQRYADEEDEVQGDQGDQDQGDQSSANPNQPTINIFNGQQPNASPMPPVGLQAEPQQNNPFSTMSNQFIPAENKPNSNELAGYLPGQQQTNPFLPQMPNLAQGAKQGIAGYNELAQAQGRVAEARVQEEQNRQAQVQQFIAQTQKDTAEHTEEMKSFLKDWMNQKIDPNHYINNMSTTQKVTTAIGLILGGMGAGILHQKNAAQEFLENQIQRDVQAQQFESSKKMNIFNAFERIYGDTQVAKNMTAAAYTAMYLSRMNQAADKEGTPIAKANAKIASVPLVNQLNQYLAQSGNMTALGKYFQNGGDPAAVMQFAVNKPEHVKPAADAYSSLRETSELEKRLLQGFEHIKNASLASKTLNRSDINSAIDSVIGPVQVDLEHRFNHEAVESLKNALVPSTTDTLKDWFGTSNVANKEARIKSMFEPELKKQKDLLDTYTMGRIPAPPRYTMSPDRR